MFYEHGRYKHAELLIGGNARTNGIVFHGLTPRFEYSGGSGEVAHIVEQGDTLQNLAARYFGGMGFPLAAMLYWAIADFQPVSILDPTLELEPNSVIYIPSPAYLQSWLMSESDSQPDRLA